MNIWKIGILGLLATIVGVAVFDDSQRQSSTSPNSSSRATEAATLAKPKANWPVRCMTQKS